MGLIDELNEFKSIIEELKLKGSISSTIYGYVYNETFKTERLGEDFEAAKLKLRQLAEK